MWSAVVVLVVLVVSFEEFFGSHPKGVRASAAAKRTKPKVVFATEKVRFRRKVTRPCDVRAKSGRFVQRQNNNMNDDFLERRWK